MHAQAFNPRDILKDCNTWQACGSLLDESPDK
jgi:hypothetical protein